MSEARPLTKDQEDRAGRIMNTMAWLREDIKMMFGLFMVFVAGAFALEIFDKQSIHHEFMLFFSGAVIFIGLLPGSACLWFRHYRKMLEQLGYDTTGC
ncbi:MAG: hypothetical protein ABIH21_02530 [Patescibacteria group bacterium]